MRDNPNRKRYSQVWENGGAVRTPQLYQPTQQMHKHGMEEMVTPSLPVKHQLEESCVEKIQTRQLPNRVTETLSDSSISEQLTTQLGRQKEVSSQSADDWKNLPSTDLLPLLLSSDFHIRTNAIQRAKLLAQPALANLISALQQAVDERQPHMRIAALQALGSLNRNEQLHLFDHALQDPEWQVRKCYYQKEGKSLQEAVLNHKQGTIPVEHLEKALLENDEMVQDLARHALRKRERRRWTETFLVSLDLMKTNSQHRIDDIPARIIVCSIAYHQVREDDVSICRSIDQYVSENRGLLIYKRACEWLDKCKEPIFHYARGVNGIKVWYDSITSPART